MFIIQKSQEISLALIKISIYIRRTAFRERIENHAFQLLETVGSRSFENAIKVVDTLKAFIEFGRLTYEIEPINSEVLLRELKSLKLALRRYAGEGGNIDIESMFSESPANFEKEYRGHREIISENGRNSDGNGGNGINSTIRQSAIIEKIRQSGNSAMKDLIAAFPGVSERTLRYDLQKLCSQGVIQRVGGGGPASYYIIAESANQAEQYGSNKATGSSL